ncbi:Long-chain-fatty-acid--CoA ligase [Alloactinosynnema sp. L-07]|uniref:AMP-binding protein n=1 Tax=Alloactinosynnema sp. L-07 TaxID=1653480 RepID=UPI00065EFE08|nr:AMP-binding protein [Alloactinosynnema sp. L-07]CRK57233.1 Long-chain-fatty-acid--CoA ligase [Alloactinosynnema sp. L-07]
MPADCVVFDLSIDHPRAHVWSIVGDLPRYSRFFRGITSCDQVSARDFGKPARYLLRACLAPGAVFDHHLETPIARKDEQLVISGSPDNGSWVSIRLENDRPGRTNLKVVFFRPMLRHPAATDWTESEIKTWVRDGVNRISDHLSGISDPRPVLKRRDIGSSPIRVARTLAAAGILTPSRPDKMLRQLKAVARWGATMVGGYTAAAGREPDGVAVINDGADTRTFRDMDERSTLLAHALRGLNVKPESKVGILARNHAILLEALIACGKLGADAVLLNTGLAAAQVEDTVRHHKTRVLIVDDDFAEKVRYVPEKVVRIWTGATAPRLDDLLADQPHTAFAAPKRPGRMIVLTSGTTGTPKGARRPTPKGLGDAATVLSRIPLRVGERVLVAAPVFHSWGLTAVQIGMPLRATLVLQRRFDAESALRAIEEHRCTAMFVVPIMLQRMLNLPVEVRERYDTSSLRIVASSGSAIPGSVVTGFMDTFGDILYNFYGSTEVSAGTIADPSDLRAAPTTAGRPPLGTALGILGVDGEQVPPGAVGRIFVGNDMLFDGYTDGMAREIKHSLMDTGDRGYFDADGRLFVAGRDDEMIVSGGENVFPRPVEEVLAALPQVDEVAVVGVSDDEYGQRLAAYVVLRPGARLDAGLVRSYVHQRLARFSVPRDVIFVDELPRNPTGKVLKRLLADEQQLVQGLGT